MSQKTHLLAAGCIVSLVLGIYTECIQAKSFTLSDEQLLLLDWGGEGKFETGGTATVTANRDIPGRGVEFDLYFPPDCNLKTDTIEYLSSVYGGTGKLVGPKKEDYDAFALKFTIRKINDSNLRDNWGPLIVGAMINRGDTPYVYRPERLGKGNNLSQTVISQTYINKTDNIETVGFMAGLHAAKDINTNNSQGLKVTLLIEPAPDADILSFYPDSNSQKVISNGKTLVVPDQYKTIQEAIDVAQYGDIINVKDGNYEETLKLKTGVSLKGLEPNAVIIYCGVIEGPVLNVEDCNSLEISGLTLKHTGLADMPDDFKGRFPVLHLTASDVAISNCKIQNSGSDGILVNAGKPVINGCVVSNNKRNGILTRGYTTVSLSDSNFCSNGAHGMYFKDMTSANVYNNACRENVYNGIAAENDRVVVNMLQNSCENNKFNGIYFGSGAKGSAKSNICKSNNYHGIAITGGGTKAIIEGNVAIGNKGNGIFIGDRATGSVMGNKCSENLWHGISVADNFSTPTIHNNNCFNNKRCGLYLDYYNSIATDNNSDDNGEISSGEILALRREKKFARLDAIASRLRTQKSRYANGNWQLNSLYKAIGEDGWSGQRYFAEIRIQLEDWIKQQPNSVTPRIGLAIAYKKYAWDARGSGYVNEVFEKGVKEFQENLMNAEKILTEAEDLNASDPELYAVWLTVGMGLGKTNEEMNALFEKGIAIEKNYWPLYINRAYSITPRWGGKPGQLEAFARHAVELTKENDGQILYFKTASVIGGMRNSEPQEFKQLSFSYPMLKQSMEDLVKRYPDANNDYLLNVSCFLACAYEDKNEAKNLLVQIGSNWDKSVWTSEDIFNKYKSWVLTKTDKPPEPNE